MKLFNKFKLIIFILIFLSIFYYLNQYSNDGKIENRWYLFEKEPRNTFDILFFGNSHNFTTVNPILIDQILDINSYVLGTPNGSLELTYAEIKHALQFQKPKVIVIETFVFDRGDDFEEPIYHFYRNIEANFMDFIEIFKLSNINNLYQMFSLSNYHVNIWKSPEFLFKSFRKNNFIFDEEYIGQYEKLVEQKGYLEKKSVIDIEEYNIIDFSNNLIIDNSRKNEYLEKIITLCEENEIKLLFYTAPIVDMKDDYNKEFYMNKISENNISYIDLNNFQFNQIHFFDRGHLNNIGSIHASLLLVDYLSKELKINQKEEEKNFFEKFDLFDYELLIHDNFLEINVNPNKNNKTEHYEWHIIQDNNKSIVITNDSSLILNNLNKNESYSIMLYLNSKKFNIAVQLLSNGKGN